MTSVGDWGEIMDEADVERFVGREQEQNSFYHHISRVPPRYLIFYITGQGGAGKSSLLSRYREISKGFNFLLTDCDEHQKDIPTVLGRFAHQLAEQGHALRHFNEKYKAYRQKLDEIENDPKAPQGLATILGRTVVRAAFIGGDLVPGLRQGLEYLPKEAMEIQASEWADYLAKKLTNKDEVALVREPVPILTSLFFEDLNEIAQRHSVLLCFENFEATRQELQGWFLHLREYKPSQHIRIVIAGRDQPGAAWDPLRNITATIHLDIFTPHEAEVFLDIYGIKNIRRRSEIVEWSGRLPVLMSWLAAPEGKEPDPTVPTSDIVERFLRWVTQPSLRQVALLAAVPQTFNVDILKPLLENINLKIDERAAFDWLQTMPFVKEHANGWQYHEVVRRMMLQYQHQKSPQTYRQMHLVLANFYNSKRNKYGLSKSEQWRSEYWRKDTLTYVYHFLIGDPIKHWIEIINLFTIAVRKRRKYAVEIIELMLTNDIYPELSDERQDIVQLFRRQLQAIEDGTFNDSFEMFQKLCSIADLSTEAKGYALTYRGECYQSMGEFERAIRDYKRAQNYIPKDIRTILHQAETYRRMERYEEALADYDRAIALDERNIQVLIGRGTVYQEMERYEEALAD